MSVEEIFKEGITEVVVTTISAKGKPNAAPMGVVRRGSRYFIRMFPDTRTLKNVEQTGYLVANVTTDPMPYVLSAFIEIEPEDFVMEKDMTVPWLKGAAAWVYCRCQIGEAVEILPLRDTIVERRVPSFSRAFPAIIEATIVGTRMRFYKADEGEKKIEAYDSIVRKCGNPREIEAMETLKKILNI